MNYLLINFILSRVVAIEGLFLLLPAITGLLYGETTDAFVYFTVGIICIIAGILSGMVKPKSNTFYAKEAFVAVSLSWLVMSLIGALPLCITRAIPHYLDALFEIVSGFTTTGSSILTNVEALSHANLIWRSFSHWIGGMGVLVFILAVLPMSGGSTMNLMKAESPGPSVGKLVPRMQQTAFLLYAIYFVLTVIEVILLLLGGMPLFDSLCHSFGTTGTGGFGIKNDSLASYSTYSQNVITIFMFLSGINFTFFYYLLIRKVKDALALEEIRWYFGFYIGAVLLITLNLVANGGKPGQSLQQVAFQVASVITSTGYATTDYNQWPEFSRYMMLFAMFIGACAGSTGGGVKVARIVLYLKQIKKELLQQIHPRRICVIKLDKKGVEHETIRSCNVFIMTWIAVFLLSIMLISFDNFDSTTNLTAVLATLNNIGPGLNMVGPSGNFSEFSYFSKLVLIFDMLAGRLELIPILILFHPATWKKKA
ncbi:MAG: TrkH family potassium uptake protein [Lachnospiraceae bacterium]|nr:TrkH family potassium uptake protein [Lachnospiraceae bacterium]